MATNKKKWKFFFFLLFSFSSWIYSASIILNLLKCETAFFRDMMANTKICRFLFIALNLFLLSCWYFNKVVEKSVRLRTCGPDSEPMTGFESMTFRTPGRRSINWLTRTLRTARSFIMFLYRLENRLKLSQTSTHTSWFVIAILVANCCLVCFSAMKKIILLLFVASLNVKVFTVHSFHFKSSTCLVTF